MTEEETFNVLKMPNKIPIDDWYAEYCERLPSFIKNECDIEAIKDCIAEFLYTKGWRFFEIFRIENNQITWYRPY